jgi:EAL and modified HD-GYP domain-containing signal transduction protein
MNSIPSTSTPTAYIGRQPILDRRSVTVGYELFYQGEDAIALPGSTGEKLVGAVLSNVLVEFGIERVVGVLPAWVDFPRSYLLEALPIPLPPSKLVIGVRLDDRPTETLVRRLEKLTQLGYEIALDDCELTPEHDPLLELADYLKLDAHRPVAQLSRFIERAKAKEVGLVAKAVDTQHDFERLAQLGFDWFQGYFVCRPELLTQARLPTNRGPLIRLLSALHATDVDIEKIQELVARDVALSYQVLRYLNSPIFALAHPVDSIRHAVVLLGVERLRNLVTLVAIGRISDRPSELLTTALVRARTCELLAPVAEGVAPDALFTVGLFSLLDALMGMPLGDILKRVPLHPEVADAITRREGIGGRLLAAIEKHEQGDWHGILTTGFDPLKISVAWLDAVAWTSSVRALTTTSPAKSQRYNRREE